MSDLDSEKLDLLEKKIDQLEVKVKTSLEEKLKEVAQDCDDLYNQITEIRNTIQEMYGEILESGRFQSTQLLKMSERLESMAKDIYKNSNHEGHSISVSVSPEISSSNNVGSTVGVPPEKEEEKKDDGNKLLDIKKMSLKEMVFYISSGLMGVIAVLGGVLFMMYKILPLFINLF